MKKRTLKILTIILMVIIVFIILIVFDGLHRGTSTQEMSLNTLKNMIHNRSIINIEIYGNIAKVIHLGDSNLQGNVHMVVLPSYYNDWIHSCLQKGIKVIIKGNQSPISTKELLFSVTQSLMSVIYYLVFIRFIFSGSMLGGKQNELIKTNVSFNDIAGMKKEKEEVIELIDFLRNNEKYKKLGCRIPKGLLLSGPPGNGKTLFAKAIAGESGVNFIATSAASFIQIYVGTGPKAIKELFETARKNAPCVIFIDEMDSLGRRDGLRGGGGDSETSKTINQFLAEMDGVVANTGVLVIGATNNPDAIDPAALRSGRFDRTVTVSNPDYYERSLVLQLYLNRTPKDYSVNIDLLAKNTAGLSRADLESLVNESKILAVRNKRNYINIQDLRNSLDRVLFGLPGTIIEKDKELRNTAYHESGHAFIQYFYRAVLKKIYKLTIIPHGRALGFLMPENSDQQSVSKAQIEAEIQVCLAGRLAEEIFFGNENVTSGCSSDLSQARSKAEHYVLYGMSDYGFASTTKVSEIRSEQEKTKIQEEVKILIDKMEKKTREIMLKNKDMIEKIALRLLEEETLTGEQISNIVENKKLLPVLSSISKAVNFDFLGDLKI